MNTRFNKFSIKKIDCENGQLVADLLNQRSSRYQMSSDEEITCKSINDQLVNNESVFFVAQTNDIHSISVGFVHLWSKYSSVNGPRNIIISDLFVISEYRNNGIALKLIEASVKFAIENNSFSIEAATLHNNEIAQRIYQSVGFNRKHHGEEYLKYYIKLGTE